MSPISTQEQGYDEQSFHASNLSAHLKNQVVLQESGHILSINSLLLSLFIGYYEKVLQER